MNRLLLYIILTLVPAHSMRAQMLQAIVAGTQPAGGGGPISAVEFLSAVLPNTTGGMATINWGTPTTTGELVVVGYVSAAGGAGSSLSSCSDSGGGTYAQLFNTNGTPGATQILYRANAPSGITSLTCTETVAHGVMMAGHFKNLATTPVDQSSGAAGTTTSPWASATVTTTAAAELLIGIDLGKFTSSNCVLTPTGLWATGVSIPAGSWDGGNGNAALLSYQIVSTVQTNIASTGTDSGTCSDFAGIATFHN